MSRCVSPIFRWFGQGAVRVHVLQGDRAAVTIRMSSSASEGYMVGWLPLSENCGFEHCKI